MNRPTNRDSDITVKWLVRAVAAFLVFILVTSCSGSGIVGYVWHDVSANEVGIKMNANNPYEVVGPGKYTQIGLFESMVNISVNDLFFTISDDEVLTSDKQRIGVLVQGTVRRPGRGNPEVLLANYGRYKMFYTSDETLLGRSETIDVRTKDSSGKDVSQKLTVMNGGLMGTLGKQAAKVCVGDSTFDKAVIGSSRDDLSQCINKEMTKLSEGYGLTVANAMVPNFVLSPAVQEQLDLITQSRFSTQVANQNAELARAKADQDLATQQGQIRVEQGKVQEKATQDARTADLQRKALEAQNAVITADKANQLLTSQKDLEIAQVQRQVAETNAQAAVAPELAKAKVYETNPAYTNYLNIQTQSGALKATDKVFILPEGTNPIVSMGQSNPSVIVPKP
jgi:hypothetical protein